MPIDKNFKANRNCIQYTVYTLYAYYIWINCWRKSL